MKKLHLKEIIQQLRSAGYVCGAGSVKTAIAGLDIPIAGYTTVGSFVRALYYQRDIKKLQSKLKEFGYGPK